MEQETGCLAPTRRPPKSAPPRHQQGRHQYKQQDPRIRTVVFIKVQTSQDMFFTSQAVGFGPHLKADWYRGPPAAACPEVETPGYEKQRFQIVFTCLQKLLEDGGVTKETNEASLTTFSTTPRGGPR